MTEYGRIHTDGSRSGGQPVLKPCPHCGKQCADLIIDQGDKWAHYSASCLEVRTGYNISDDAPWRVEAIAAYNTRQPTQSDALQAENEALRHDLERQMTIANEHVNEAERLQAEAQARYDRGYYDGITHPLEQSDALRDQLLRECLVKLRDVQGTEAPKQYACNLIKRIERVLQGQSK